MKTKIKALIFGGVNLFILIVMLVIVLLLNISWWWFFSLVITSIITWIITGIILFVNSLKNKNPKLEKIELDDAILMAKNYSLHHPDNPDNFIMEGNERIVKVGEQGAEKTPVLVIPGYGTETTKDRYFIINQKNKAEFDMLIDPSKEELEKAIVNISDSQPTPVITEQVPGTDSFGRPTTKFITKTTSRAEIKKQDEEKKAEEDLAL